MGKENRSTVLDNNPTCTFVSDAPYIVAATLHEQHFPNPRPPVTHELCLQLCPKVFSLEPAWRASQRNGGMQCIYKKTTQVHVPGGAAHSWRL